MLLSFTRHHANAITTYLTSAGVVMQVMTFWIGHALPTPVHVTTVVMQVTHSQITPTGKRAEVQLHCPSITLEVPVLA